MVGTAVNLPSVLGFVFSTTNKIGDGLTKLAESAFSTPSSTGTASMTDSGGYLGALKQTISIMSYNPSAVNMVDSTGNTIDGSADFLNLWGTFFSQCVYAVANNKGKDGDNFRVERLYSLGILGNIMFADYEKLKENIIEGRVLNSIGKKICNIIF